MEFARRKLPREEATQLKSFPISDVEPYRLMLAPVYVFMRRNEKFVSVKAPLDFFTSEELERMKSFELFYHPPFADSLVAFTRTGRRIRAVLSQQDPPPPYEVSDQVIRALGPLWGVEADQLTLEPFFAVAVVLELCDPLPKELLLQARERDVELFERGVFLSGLSVFAALHLGYCDLVYLNRLFEGAFRATLNAPIGSEHPLAAGSEGARILQLARSLYGEAGAKDLREGMLRSRPDSFAQKFLARLQRVKDKLVDRTAPVVSIFGSKGFADG